MSSRHREWDPACKVYIGNLRSYACKGDIEDAFSKYGILRNVWVARNPPGFAFVEYEDPRDAEDAVKALDGTRLYGTRIVVEMSKGKSRGSDRSGSRRDYDRDRSRDYRRRSPSYSSYSRRKSRSRSRSSYRRSRSPRSRSPHFKRITRSRTPQYKRTSRSVSH